MFIRTRRGVLLAVAIVALLVVHVLVTFGVLETSRWLGSVAIAIVLVAVATLHAVGIHRLLRRRRAARVASRDLGAR